MSVATGFIIIVPKIFLMLLIRGRIFGRVSKLCLSIVKDNLPRVKRVKNLWIKSTVKMCIYLFLREKITFNYLFYSNYFSLAQLNGPEVNPWMAAITNICFSQSRINFFFLSPISFHVTYPWKWRVIIPIFLLPFLDWLLIGWRPHAVSLSFHIHIMMRQGCWLRRLPMFSSVSGLTADCVWDQQVTV